MFVVYIFTLMYNLIATIKYKIILLNKNSTVPFLGIFCQAFQQAPVVQNQCGIAERNDTFSSASQGSFPLLF